MAIGRPVWTGQIRLSLVALPVKLYSATESAAKIAFHQIHEPSGKRIRYEKVAPGVGPVDSSEIVKGYQIDKDEYVIVTEDEIADIKIEAKRTLDLTQFVDAEEIDPIYFDRPYYVAPDGELAEDPFNVVRAALERTKTVGLGQIVMHGREHIAALKPHDKGMVLETLRYKDELRKSEPYFAEIEAEEPDEELVNLAEELIGRKTAAFDAGAFVDRYSAALKELVERKAKGERGAVVVDEEATKPRRGEVIDLMEALKKSLGPGGKPPRGGGAAGKAKAPAKPKAKRRKSAA